MSLGGTLRLGAAVVGITVITILYYLRSEELDGLGIYVGRHAALENEINVQPGYLVWSPECKILDLDPWDASIRPFLNPRKPLVCSNVPLLTFVERRKGVGNVLKIDQETVGKYKVHRSHNIGCCFSVISRVSQSVDKYNSDADNKYKLSTCTQFKKEVVLSNTTEFVLVKCQSIMKQKQGKEVYKNLHATVPILPQLEERLNNFEKKTEGSNETVKSQKKLSVIILGIDSVSRLNLRRTMPYTLRYLQRNEWVELNGYNKIADNTFPNLMAILSGQNMSQLSRQCYVNKAKKMDDCPNIWKEYRKSGYVTAYAEDAPNIGTFNFLQTGFVEQPTDYYLRPFMLAAHALLSKKNLDGLPVCVGPVAVVDHVFEYAKSFVSTFDKYNYFGLFWLNSLSHNDVNSPVSLDFRLHRFLKDLNELGAYENSVIILLSDHGMRFGYIRKTFLGYFEERLPFVFVWFPKWFREKYPSKYKNLLINQNRLTTPYDIHVMIKQLLQSDTDQTEVKSKACPKCVSLLESVPWNRGCADAEIDPHWCMCPDFKDVDVADPQAVYIGAFLYEMISNKTKELLIKENIKEPLCANWTSWKVVRAHGSRMRSAATTEPAVNVSDSNDEAYENYVIIIIEVQPGFAMFEATIRVKGTVELPELEVVGFISRLDSYLNTSKCVHSRLLKFYCYCW